MARQLPCSRQLLALTAMVAGVGIGSAGIASAATSSTTSTAASATGATGTATGTTGAPPSAGPSVTSPPPKGGALDPATLAHGPGETLLTGSTLTGAEAAANAAVPDATIVRTETDAQGATYEVHMKKADGTYVSVQLDASFTVTASESGFGDAPTGSPAGGATPPTPATSSSSASTK